MFEIEKLPLRKKLNTSFGIISGITATIGLIGFVIIFTITYKSHKITTVLLPSLESILEMKNAQAEIDSAENALLYQGHSKEEKEKIIQGFEKSIATFDINRKIYEPLEQTPEESIAWNKFVPSWENYIKYHNEYVDLVRTYIKDPSKDNYDKMSKMALITIAGPFNEARDLMNQIAKINSEGSKQADIIITRLTYFAITFIIAASVLGVLLALALGRKISTSIADPLAEAATIARSGNLKLRLKVQNNDEIGELSKAFNAMTDRLQTKTNEAIQLAEGNLSQKIEVISEQDDLGKAFSLMNEKLKELITQVKVAVEQIKSGSFQVSQASQSLSQGATEQASAVEEISSSMTEMGSQTTKNANSATMANNLVKETKTTAEVGKTKIQSTVLAMDEINTTGQEMAKIIKVIDEIAFQTNLLALNAAVEAARAGKHGKGFAVVAEEVRNLASRSAQAAKETTELIESSAKKSEQGLQRVNETASSFEEIVNGIIKTTDLISEIAISSDEQAKGINQITVGLQQIDKVTQLNTANAEETASSAEELSSQAAHLNELVNQFKL